VSCRLGKKFLVTDVAALALEPQPEARCSGRVAACLSVPLASSWSLPAGSLDRWPEDYERGRPGWLPEVVDIPGLASVATVLELGAGTGKLTRLLASTFGRVVAVEPSEGMRRLLVELCPDAEALAGSAEEIPLADASDDAVFAAEAFHKFDGRRALAEIARVLRPRGALVLMWNLPRGPRRSLRLRLWSSY
jgi:SAM-dependent methyltransferase